LDKYRSGLSNYIVNFFNYVHRNEEVENTTITDDAVQLLQINVGN
jgi:hypothetical protein